MNWLKNPFRNRTGICKCDACNGTGITRSKILNCQKCQGTGKLDWVEKVVGKRPPDPNQIVFNNYPSFPTFTKLLVLKVDLQTKVSFKQLLSLIRGIDIFLEFGKYSIPFLKTILLLNVLVWIILFFGAK